MSLDLRDAHPSLEELTAFDRGRLRPRERAAIERHIAACAACCQRLDNIGDDDLISLLRTSLSLSSPTDSLHTHAPAEGPSPDRNGGSTDVPVELIDHPRYRVLGPLGVGGMGVVFKAEHRLMERIVALKIIHKNLTQRPELVERFRQEVKAAARLSHANIATAYDAEQSGDLHFLVMEYVAGTNLEHLVRARGPLPIAQASDIVRQAALGLQHAHEHGMVHRDIKPQNLLVTPAGQVKILDFGLARFCSESNSGSLTAPGTVVGTPDYLAPEQALDAHQTDARADIYSLGCTFFFLLAGQPPFLEGSALQKLLAHQQRTPPSLAAVRPDLPPALIRIVEQMMAKDPAQRIPSAARVAELLAPFAVRDGIVAAAVPPGIPGGAAATPTPAPPGERRGLRSGRRRWLILSITAAALLGVVLTCLFLFRPRPERPSHTRETVADLRASQPFADGEMSRVVGAVNPCTRAVLAPDCRRALVAGLDFHVYLEELGNDRVGTSRGRVLCQLQGHTKRPLSFAFSHDGRRALSGSVDNTVRLWDLEQRKLLRTFEKHTSWVRGVDFVAETGLALSGDNHGRVLLWDTRDGRLIHAFIDHEALIYSVRVARSGRLAVTTSDDRTVRVWNLSLLHQAHCLRGHEDRTSCAVLSADERLVVSGSNDRTVRVWDVKTERARWVLRGHTATVNAVAISADGRRAVSADQAGSVRLWDLQSGKLLRAYQTPVVQVLRDVAFCPDGHRIVSAGEDGVFRLWRMP